MHFLKAISSKRICWSLTPGYYSAHKEKAFLDFCILPRSSRNATRKFLFTLAFIDKKLRRKDKCDDMQSRKVLKPILVQNPSRSSLSISRDSKEDPGAAPPAEHAGATASVTLNTAYAKVSSWGYMTITVQINMVTSFALAMLGPLHQ